jgi:hypothetical protein
MNILVSPASQFNENESQWVKQYVREVYNVILPLALRALPQLQSDPWDDYRGTLEIVIHPSAFFDNGGWNAGLSQWFPPNGNSRIQVAWDYQTGVYGNQYNPLIHELGHWLGCQAGSPHWGEMCHGTPNDPLMNILKGDLLKAYAGNYVIQHS